MKDNTKNAANAAPAAGQAAPEVDLATLADQAGQFERAMASEIRAKMKAGLTREQAIEVCKAQVRQDAIDKAEAEAKAKAKAGA